MAPVGVSGGVRVVLEQINGSVEAFSREAGLRLVHEVLKDQLAGSVVGNLYSNPKITPAQQAVRDGAIGDFAAIAVFGGLILLLVLIFAKGRRLNAFLLALLIAMNLGGSVLVVAAGL